MHWSRREVELYGIPLLAAMVYGFWAFWVNQDHGWRVGLKSGLGQGGYAMIATWLVNYVAVTSLERLGHGLKAVCISFGLCFSFMLIIPLLIHLLLETPEVWFAILPGLVWGSGYIAVFIWRKRIQLIYSQ